MEVRYFAYALVFSLAMALTFKKGLWEVLRHPSTLVHELGHAITGIVAGATLQGISLHRDSSGETHTAHKVSPFPISRFVTTSAGYPAPGAVGIAILLLSVYEKSSYGLWLLLGLAVMCLLFARTLFTVLVAISFGLPSALLIFLLGGGMELFKELFLVAVAAWLLRGGAHGLRDLTSITLRQKERETDAVGIASVSPLNPHGAMIYLWFISIAAVIVSAVVVFLLVS